MIDPTGRNPNISNSINMMHRACLAPQSKVQRTMLCSILCGRMPLKALMITRRLDACVTVLHVRVWYTYLLKPIQNCINQTSAHLFYAISTAKNLFIYGADVSNAFAKAPPPKQSFFIRPDCAFNKWWVNQREIAPNPKGSRGPYPICNARPPRISTPLGKARQQDSTGDLSHTYGT
jgi:hypothetical protein